MPWLHICCSPFAWDILSFNQLLTAAAAISNKFSHQPGHVQKQLQTCWHLFVTVYYLSIVKSRSHDYRHASLSLLVDSCRRIAQWWCSESALLLSPAENQLPVPGAHCAPWHLQKFDSLMIFYTWVSAMSVYIFNTVSIAFMQSVELWLAVWGHSKMHDLQASCQHIVLSFNMHFVKHVA